MKIIFSLVLLAAAAPAFAEDIHVNTGLTQTLGTSHYAGTSAYVKIKKGEYSVKPTYSQYRDDFSSGTYKTLSLRGAYDTKTVGLGATIGGTPKINGYSNVFFGADGIVSLSPTGGKADKRIKGGNDNENGARGSGLARVDLGGGIKHTVHRDDIALGGKGRPNSLTLGETDLNASAGVEVFDNWLSLDVTKSVYDKDVAGNAARPSRVMNLPGIGATFQGYPNSSVSLRYEYEALPVLVPYATYTHTTYIAQVPNSDAVIVGADAEFGIAEVGASYERWEQQDSLSRNLFSLSGSLRF